MGQAKKRGSFEERRAIAVVLETSRCRAKQLAMEERRRLADEAEERKVAGMTEEERDAYYTRPRRRSPAVAAMAIAAAFGAAAYF